MKKNEKLQSNRNNKITNSANSNKTSKTNKSVGFEAEARENANEITDRSNSNITDCK